MPPPLRLLVVLLLFHLPFSLSSHHKHHAPAPSPRPTPPAANYAAPLPVLLACNATRFQPACVSTLSAANATAESSTSDLLGATLSALRARIPPAVSTARSVLASSSNVNLSGAATNCLTLLSLSSHRLSPPPSPSSLLPASAALLHLYDCWSAYKYVNFSRTISDAMAYLNDTITVSSNYISMLAALQRYGDDTSRWAPPQTERDGYWPPPADAEADVDALGVPKGLPANATVCGGGGCDYKTVREAVAAAPDGGGEGRFVVHVKEGVYKETVSVPWEKANLVLVGDGMGKTVITGDLNADTPGVSTFNTATVDAGVALEARKSGAGGIARSVAGFLGAWSKPYDGITDPLMAEILSLRDGVIFAKLRGFPRVVMEVDCLEAVNLWDSRAVSRSVVAPILQEIEGLASSFISFVIQHVSRSANMPAHLCAKFACTQEVTCCWMELPPSFLVSSIFADNVGLQSE